MRGRYAGGGTAVRLGGSRVGRIRTASGNERSSASTGAVGPLHPFAAQGMAVAVLIDPGGCDAHRAPLCAEGVGGARRVVH